MPRSHHGLLDLSTAAAVRHPDTISLGATSTRGSRRSVGGGAHRSPQSNDPGARSSGDKLPESEARAVFVSSLMAVEDEMETTAHTKMLFVDFLEAVCRVAQAKEGSIARLLRAVADAKAKKEEGTNAEPER